MTQKNKTIYLLSMFRIIVAFLLLFFIVVYSIKGYFELVIIALVILAIITLFYPRVIIRRTYILFLKKAKIKYCDILRYNITKIENTSIISLNVTVTKEKIIRLPLKKFSEKQICKLIEELFDRTGIKIDNNSEELKNCFEICKIRRSIFLIVETLIALIPIVRVSINDYVTKPFRKYEKEVWIDESYKEYSMYIMFQHIIPEPSEVGAYEDYIFYSCYNRNAYINSLFGLNMAVDAVGLELTYSSDNYINAEYDLFNRFIFLDEAIPYKDDGWRMPFIEIQLGDFTLKIVDGLFCSIYPTYIPFIAYNSMNKVRYCFLYANGLQHVKDEKEMISYIKSGFQLDW